MRRVTENIEKEIIHDYVDLRLSLNKTGKKYGLNQKQVETILKKYGIKKRNYIDAKQLCRKFPCDDNYFKNQNHNMAYILGLLASDGSVSKKENLVAIQLLKEDSAILEKIRNETQSQRPLEYYIRKETGHEVVSFRVWSKIWKDDLSHYGIIPQKTFTLNPPIFLTEQYRKDYLRGFFDGDGSIYKIDTNFDCIRLEFVSCSYKEINWIYNELVNHYHIYTNKISKEHKKNGTIVYKVLVTSKEELLKLYNLFYNDTDFYIPRKKEKFQSLLNIPRDSNSLDKE